MNLSQFDPIKIHEQYTSLCMHSSLSHCLPSSKIYVYTKSTIFQFNVVRYNRCCAYFGPKNRHENNKYQESLMCDRGQHNERQKIFLIWSCSLVSRMFFGVRIFSISNLQKYFQNADTTLRIRLRILRIRVLMDLRENSRNIAQDACGWIVDENY